MATKKKATAKKATQKAVKKAPAKKQAVKKTVTKKANTSAKVQKKVGKTTARKVVATKVAAKKPQAKKTIANKAVAKSMNASKVAAKVAPKAVAKVAPKAVAKPAPKAVMKPVAVQPVAKPVMQLVEKKAPVAVKAVEKRSFAVGDYVVYPTHGVGRITGIEVEVIGEYELKVFVIAFEKDKMILRVPVGRAATAGLRGISGNEDITRALTTLKGRAKTARGMWSRRAQEYEAKINSGNIVMIAEVVRDLHKNVDQSERSYSERMIYETAMNRLTGEVAAFDKVDTLSAHDKLIKVLKKQAA